MFRLPLLRRVTGIVAVLLTMLLAIVSGGAACPLGASATSGATAARGATAAHCGLEGRGAVSHASAMSRGHADHHGRHIAGPGCTMPCVPSTCAVGVHCATLDAAPAASALVARSAPSDVHARIHSRAPRSGSIAPDPPPPRV